MFIIVLAIVLVTFILLIFLMSVLNKTRTSNLEHHEEEERELLQRIEHLTSELARKREQVESNRQDKKTNLPNAVNNVLDIYEQSNIRVPADIIEELAFQTFYNETDVFNFIENQRNYWKLENTKKPYKGGRSD